MKLMVALVLIFSAKLASADVLSGAWSGTVSYAGDARSERNLLVLNAEVQVREGKLEVNLKTCDWKCHLPDARWLSSSIVLDRKDGEILQNGSSVGHINEDELAFTQKIEWTVDPCWRAITFKRQSGVIDYHEDYFCDDGFQELTEGQLK